MGSIANIGNQMERLRKFIEKIFTESVRKNLSAALEKLNDAELSDNLKGVVRQLKTLLSDENINNVGELVDRVKTILASVDSDVVSESLSQVKTLLEDINNSKIIENIGSLLQDFVPSSSSISGYMGLVARLISPRSPFGLVGSFIGSGLLAALKKFLKIKGDVELQNELSAEQLAVSVLSLRQLAAQTILLSNQPVTQSFLDGDSEDRTLVLLEVEDARRILRESRPLRNVSMLQLMEEISSTLKGMFPNIYQKKLKTRDLLPMLDRIVVTPDWEETLKYVKNYWKSWYSYPKEMLRFERTGLSYDLCKRLYNNDIQGSDYVGDIMSALVKNYQKAGGDALFYMAAGQSVHSSGDKFLTYVEIILQYTTDEIEKSDFPEDKKKHLKTLRTAYDDASAFVASQWKQKPNGYAGAPGEKSPERIVIGLLPDNHCEKNNSSPPTALAGKDISVSPGAPDGYAHSLTFKSQLPTGLTFQKITADGHCFYNAVALYVGVEQQELRNLLVSRVNDGPDSDELRTLLLERGLDVSSYLAGVQSNQWAGDIEMETLMRILGRRIVVIGNQGTIVNESLIRDRFSNNAPIFVFYNGRDHYDALLLQAGHDGEDLLNNLFQRQATLNHEHAQRNSHVSLQVLPDAACQVIAARAFAEFFSEGIRCLTTSRLALRDTVEGGKDSIREIFAIFSMVVWMLVNVFNAVKYARDFPKEWRPAFGKKCDNFYKSASDAMKKTTTDITELCRGDVKDSNLIAQRAKEFGSSLRNHPARFGAKVLTTYAISSLASIRGATAQPSSTTTAGVPSGIESTLLSGGAATSQTSVVGKTVASSGPNLMSAGLRSVKAGAGQGSVVGKTVASSGPNLMSASLRSVKAGAGQGSVVGKATFFSTCQTGKVTSRKESASSKSQFPAMEIKAGSLSKKKHGETLSEVVEDLKTFATFFDKRLSLLPDALDSSETLLPQVK